MSNQEAIALLRNLEDSLDSYCELSEEGKTAFRMAIEALSSSEFPNSSDTISRQAAIMDAESWVAADEYEKNLQKKVVEWLKEFPSAQPEIIRCRDCKYNATSKKCLNPNSFFLVPADDDFCSFAERREVTT